MTKQKKEPAITRMTLIADIVEKWPEVAEVLVEDYGFHCIGCFASSSECIDDGAKVHGMSDDEIKVMLENINELVEQKPVLA